MMEDMSAIEGEPESDDEAELNYEIGEYCQNRENSQCQINVTDTGSVTDIGTV